MFNENMKRDWKGYLKNNLFSLFIVISLIVIGMTIAGDIIVKEGDFEISKSLNVQGSLDLETDTITASTTLDTTHNIVLADNTADITVTLPAALSNTDKTYYIKKTDSGSAIVTIDGSGAETIDGETTVVLYIQYDAVRIVSNGSEWFIISDEIIGHRTIMYRSTAQSMPGSVTKIDLSSTEFDIGGISDTSTDFRVEIRRSGKYYVAAHVAQLNDFVDQDAMFVYVYKNGAAISDLMLWTGNTLSTPSTFHIVSSIGGILDLEAGDWLELKKWHDSSGSIDTETDRYSRPRLEVSEIRF